MSNVFDVAAAILERVDIASTMKLQKLVFYAQAKSLVDLSKPLFSEKIEAWVNGPVVPALFRVHSGEYLVKKGFFDRYRSSAGLDTDQKACIDIVVNCYGSYTGEQLREKTHEEAPWLNARGACAVNDRCTTEITQESIRDYYKSTEFLRN